MAVTKVPGSSDDAAVPVLAAVEEGHQPAALLHRAFDQDVRIDAHQPAAVVGVAVAGATEPLPDVAEHRAGVAADLVLLRFRHGRSIAVMAARTRSGVAGVRVMRAPVAWWMALRMAGAVGIKRLLADALGAEGADGRGAFDEDGLDGRHVADGGDEIVVQVLAASGRELLHQRHADALGDAALDLAFDQDRIDGAADVMCRRDLEDLHGAEIEIDLHLGEVSAIAIDGVGNALPVRIEGRGRRVEALFRAEHIAMRVARLPFEDDRAHHRILDHDEPAIGDVERRVFAGIGEAQHCAAERTPRRVQPPFR